jgi:excisionase family DNA binding protein
MSKFLPIKDFVERYPFSRTHTYELLQKGKLRAAKLGKKTLVNTESADELLAGLPEYKAQTGGGHAN